MNSLSTRERARPGASGGTSEAGEQSLRVRLRVLLVAAFGPIVTCYAAVAALFALVSAIAPHARFSGIGALLAAGPGVLAVYQVPVEIGGSPLGVLPLLPTIAVCLLVLRTAGGAAQRLGYRDPSQAVTVVGVIAGAHGLCGALIALLSSGAPFNADPLAGLLVPTILSGISALFGLARQCGITAGLRRAANAVATDGVRAGALGIAALCAAGAVTVTIGMLSTLPLAHDLFAAGASGFGGGLGLFLLSVAYLPNAVVAGLSMASGAGFSIGELTVSPFGYTAGPLPGVPLLASVPESYAPWWPLLLVLPAAAGALVGWSVRHAARDAFARLRIVGIAGVMAALACVVLATVAGGRLGTGALDPVEVPAGLLSLATFGWIVVPGAAVAWFGGKHPPLRRGRRAEVDTDADELDEDPDEDFDEEFDEDVADDELDDDEFDDESVEDYPPDDELEPEEEDAEAEFDDDDLDEPEAAFEGDDPDDDLDTDEFDDHDPDEAPAEDDDVAGAEADPVRRGDGR